MINTKYVRDNEKAIRISLEKRRMDYDIDGVLELDKKWREALMQMQKLQAERNKTSLQVSELKKKHQEDDAAKLIEKMGRIKETLENNEIEVKKYESDIGKLLLNLPNILDDSVPYGSDDTQNVEIKRFGGQIKKRGILGHEELALKLNLLDIERAAKVSGARFYYLKGDLALLDNSLVRYALDFLAEKGYTPILPPFMMREQMYRWVTALGDFEQVLYKVDGSDEKEDLRMIATSEHPIAAMYQGEVLETGALPIKYAGTSPCFRIEAGTHGKDTKGIFRVHQFNKVEQFVFARQSESWRIFDELLDNSEQLFKKLEIPYRVVNMCTGDIGIVAAKKCDIEAYMPVQDRYREVVSCSNCTDWQSMRLDIKYDEGGERKYVHTLNSTGIATTRTIVAIIENYANEDGTITVPQVLVPYMKKRLIG